MNYLCGKKPGFGWPVDLSYSMVLCGGLVGIWTSVIPTTHVNHIHVPEVQIEDHAICQ